MPTSTKRSTPPATPSATASSAGSPDLLAIINQEARKELLKRLLKLNHERAAEEQNAVLTQVVSTTTRKSSKKNVAQRPTEDLELFRTVSFRDARLRQMPAIGSRTRYQNDGDLWSHFVHQFLLQTREEAHLNLLSETWQSFANPTALLEQCESLSKPDLQAWKKAQFDQVPKQGFHKFIAGLHGSGLITVDRQTLRITLPLDSALRKLNQDEWIDFEIAMSLALLAKRPDIEELLTDEISAPDSGKILSFIAA